MTKEYSHQHYLKNKTKILEKTAKYRKTHPIQHAISKYKVSARSRGLIWGLSKEEATTLLTAECYYCLAKPNPRNGIDRVDNAKGYILGNVVTACKQCNWAKQTYSAEAFVAWATKVANVSSARC